MDTYTLIRAAIEKRQQVIATYRGYRREMCPHAIGFNRVHERQALFYQFAGDSASGLGPPGSAENWRCIPIDELHNVEVREGEWHTAPDHTRRETCVFHQLELEVRPQP